MLVEQVVATQLLGVMVKAFDPVACRDGWYTFAGYADDGAITLEPVTFRVIERATSNPELAPDVAHDDDDLTERTAEMLRDPEMMHKTGWVTPCDDWVDVHTITAHAATCATCRGAAQLPED